MCFASEEKSYCWEGKKDLCRGDCLQWNKCFARVSWGIYSATNRRSSPSAQNPIRFTSRSCLTWPTFHASSCRISITLHLLVHKTQSPKVEYWQILITKDSSVNQCQLKGHLAYCPNSTSSITYSFYITSSRKPGTKTQATFSNTLLQEGLRIRWSGHQRPAWKRHLKPYKYGQYIQTMMGFH